MTKQRPQSARPERPQAKDGARRRRRRRAAVRTRRQQPRPTAGQTGLRMKIGPVEKYYGPRLAHSSAGEVACAMSIALPATNPAVRLPSVEMPRTSIMTLRDTMTLASPSGASSINGFPSGNILFAYYGQPGRLAVHTKMADAASYYNCKFNNGGYAGSNNKVWWIWKNAIAGNYVQAVAQQWPFLGCDWNTTSNGQHHGLSLPAGVARSGNYIFMNVDDTLKLYFSPNGMSGEITYTIVKYATETSPPGSFKTLKTSIPTATTTEVLTTFVNTEAGHYAVIVDSISTTTAGVGAGGCSVRVELLVPSSATTPKWANVVMGDVDPNNNGDLNVIESCRVNAAAFLISNTTAAISKQGTIIAARIRENFPYDLSSMMLARAKEKYNDLAEKGCYSFKEFSESEEVFKNNADEGHLNYDLDYPGYYHFVSISNPGYATSPNSFTVSFDTTLEFKTDIARYASGVSMLQHGDLIEARRIINSNPSWFYENPLHMSDIYGFFMKGARLARQYGPAALDAAAILDPSRAAVYRSAKQLMF